MLLTGGEPFLRKDLPEIVRAFVRNGVHVRMQTNGYASEEALQRCVESGGRDISISLDSLDSGRQDDINGGFPGSWRRALETISMVTHRVPARESFAALGCVLSPDNIEDVEDVVRFGTEIGWYTSLVPVHVTDQAKPMDFRSYDRNLRFGKEQYGRVDALLDRLKEGKKRAGLLLYDSDQYLDDIKRFVRGEPIQWRDRNSQTCDSPGLYFAILPNGNFSVCCDHRLRGKQVPVYDADFPQVYRGRAFRRRAIDVAQACSGCMFGSYPEISITSRFLSATLERSLVFLGKTVRKPWPLTVEQLEHIAEGIRKGRPAHT